MVLKFQAFSCLVVLVNLVRIIEMLEEYVKIGAQLYNYNRGQNQLIKLTDM